MNTWAAAFGLVGVLAGAAVTWALGRRKAVGDAGQSISTAAANIAEASDEQITRMRVWLEQASILAEKAQLEAAELRAELLVLRVHVREAEAQMSALRTQLDQERLISRQEISRLTRK